MLRSGQQERICEALCLAAGPKFAGSFDQHGITKRFKTAQRAAYSSSEELLLEIALDVWNGDGKAHLGRLLKVLNGRQLRLVGELLVALGTENDDGVAAEAWLTKYERR